MVLVNACGKDRPATLAWDMDHSALENSESPLILTIIIPTTIVEPALFPQLSALLHSAVVLGHICKASRVGIAAKKHPTSHIASDASGHSKRGLSYIGLLCAILETDPSARHERISQGQAIARSGCRDRNKSARRYTICLGWSYHSTVPVSLWLRF